MPDISDAVPGDSARQATGRSGAGFGVPFRFLIALILAALVPARAEAAPATQLALSNHPCLIQVCAHPVPPIPTTVESGASFPVFVAALDSRNARDIGFTGTVILSSSDPLATLAPPYVFVTEDEGGRGFSVILRTPGAQTITVMDVSGTLTPGTLTMTVTAPGFTVGIPTLTIWTKLALALLLGLAGVWVFRR